MKYLVSSRENLVIGNLDEYVSKDSIVRTLDSIIEGFDLENLGFNMGKNTAAGRPRYNPKDLLKLYVYGLLNGIRSVRKLEELCKLNIEVIWLMKGFKPCFKTISNFRDDNIDFFENLFDEFVSNCMEMGLYEGKILALDGTRLEANASKRKNYSLKKLAIQKAEAYSNLEEYILKKNKSKIEYYQSKLKFYDEIETFLNDNNLTSINLTDPDAKTVKFGASNGTDVGYNIQSVVDSKEKLILTLDVSDSAEDGSSLIPLALKTKKKLNGEKFFLIADKGYYSARKMQFCYKHNIITCIPKIRYSSSIKNKEYSLERFSYNSKDNTFVCPEGAILSNVYSSKSKTECFANAKACNECQNSKLCTTSSTGRKITRARGESALANKFNKIFEKNESKFALRKALVEHPFGTLKRVMNFYHVTLRTKRKVRGEVALAFFVYNLKRVINIKGKQLSICHFPNLYKLIFKFNLKYSYYIQLK
ncbi:MAG: IS1182 family transposase [Paraclostridium sp.]|uniref:IS1182 family transposase n=1 Tax=Paraclostridium sp. TaxID=2023273 RepID=UPI003F350768